MRRYNLVPHGKIPGIGGALRRFRRAGEDFTGLHQAHGAIAGAGGELEADRSSGRRSSTCPGRAAQAHVRQKLAGLSRERLGVRIIGEEPLGRCDTIGQQRLQASRRQVAFHQLRWNARYAKAIIVSPARSQQYGASSL